jgi:hypothetical protein
MTTTETATMSIASHERDRLSMCRLLVPQRHHDEMSLRETIDRSRAIVSIPSATRVVALLASETIPRDAGDRVNVRSCAHA